MKEKNLVDGEEIGTAKIWFLKTEEKIVQSRVKQRSFGLHLLIKLHGRFSRMQLSSGVSLCRRWIFHSAM
jgi:hypothetical protein